MPVFLSVVLGGIFLLVTFLFWAPPNNFQSNTHILVYRGMTVAETAQLLKKAGIIRSPFTFKLIMKVAPFSGVVAGGYVFEKPVSLGEVVIRVARGYHGPAQTKITFPEGSTIRKVAEICSKDLPGCSYQGILNAALGSEGYLFPDTYFFQPGTPPQEIVTRMRNNFEEKIQTLSPEISKLSKPLSDIIIMASLLEGEGNNMENRQIISGILWKRLSRGMPLQVDATFVYINGKGSSELSLSDLAADSPYNTYTRKGLPPGPINNPGLESIKAALLPIDTPYFYYLNDKDGNFHYAVTHEEHVQNKKRYLNL